MLKKNLDLSCSNLLPGQFNRPTAPRNCRGLPETVSVLRGFKSTHVALAGVSSGPAASTNTKSHERERSKLHFVGFDASIPETINFPNG